MIRHYVPGLPDLEPLVDADGNLLPWIELTGCVIEPGPSFDRECEDCGLRWAAWSGARRVVSTWRELRDRIGVATDDDANDWLDHLLLAPTSIAPRPPLDEPQAEIVVRCGTAQQTLRFPFTYAEWESALIDLFEESSRRASDGLEEGAAGTAGV